MKIRRFEEKEAKKVNEVAEPDEKGLVRMEKFKQ